MREEDSNWFARWEEELPSLEELMPMSQTLITPNLALAFDIRNPPGSNGNNFSQEQQQQQEPSQQQQQQQQQLTPPTSNNNNNPLGPDFGAENSAEMGSAAGSDEPARTLKRPRLVWTPQLHKRFVDAVAHLGIKNAVPKTIMQLMSVDGLTRENVASHLQKYRLYLKRMQGLSGSGGAGGVNGVGAGGVNADPATDHLFASSPVPPHFLHPGRANSDHFLPYVPVAALHQQQMAVAAAAAVVNPHLQSHQYHRQIGHFGSPTNGQFEHHLFARQAQPHQVHRMGGPVHSSVPSSYVDDLESANGGRKVLTLFPTGDD